MDFTILDITELAPPYFLIRAIIEIYTDVNDNHVLNTTISRLTGNIVTQDAEFVNYLKQTIGEGVTRISDNKYINNFEFLVFLNNVSIIFTSIYPLKSFPRYTTNSITFIGDPVFNYQNDKAEIRYTINNKTPKIKSKLYKEELIFKQEHIILKYKVFYKGKQSNFGKIEFNVIKDSSNFYKLNET